MSVLTPGRKLRALLAGSDIAMAPGTFSPLVAKMIQQAGFPAMYLTGAGVSGGVYGLPDVGLVTMTELVNTARACTESADIPLICDADTGFGNAINVRRCIRELEAAGVAAIHIEDQEFPKKCGYFSGHTLTSIAEMNQRLHAALDARRDADTMIIARVEAAGASGMDEVIERGCAYQAAGAEMIFVNGLTTEAQVIRVAAEIPGPLLYNVSTSGKAPHLHIDRLRELGYRLAIYPAHSLFLALHGIGRMLAGLKQNGSIAPYLDLTGVPDIEALERRYAGEPSKE